MPRKSADESENGDGKASGATSTTGKAVEATPTTGNALDSGAIQLTQTAKFDKVCIGSDIRQVLLRVNS